MGDLKDSGYSWLEYSIQRRPCCIGGYGATISNGVIIHRWKQRERSYIFHKMSILIWLLPGLRCIEDCLGGLQLYFLFIYFILFCSIFFCSNSFPKNISRDWTLKARFVLNVLAILAIRFLAYQVMLHLCSCWWGLRSINTNEGNRLVLKGWQAIGEHFRLKSQTWNYPILPFETWHTLTMAQMFSDLNLPFTAIPWSPFGAIWKSIYAYFNPVS